MLSVMRLTHYYHKIETGNDSFRFKESAAVTKGRKNLDLDPDLTF